MTRLNPYINFKDTTKDAMEFYKSVFGGKLDMTTFQEGHMSQNSEEENKIMHAMLETDNGMALMASDTPTGMDYTPGTNVSISVSGDDEAALKGYWGKLSPAAKITMPLEKAPWGDTFGMLTDKFGIQWMVNIAGKKGE